MNASTDDPKSKASQRNRCWQMREEMEDSAPAQAIAQNPFVRVAMEIAAGYGSHMLDE